MLVKLFSASGIDFYQWKALTWTAIRLANRQSSIQIDSGSRRGKDMNWSLLISGFVYLVLGLVMTSFVFKIHDMFWSSLILYTVVSFMVGSLMLVEFGTIVVAPEDYHIFSVQPVSSKTYFAAKVTFALLYILFYTLALGLPSVVTYGIVTKLQGGSATYDPLLMLAALAGLVFVGIGVAMSMILLYATILRHVHFRKLKNVLSYLQLIMSFVVYGSYSLLPSLIENIGNTLPDAKPWWVYILPMSWYSALVDLACGKTGPGQIVLSMLGLGVFVGIIPLAFSKISLTYAESISRASTVPEEKAVEAGVEQKRRNPFFRRDEDRAIAALIKGQFKYDTRFRLGILAIIPLTILYVLMGLRGGGRFFDPFNPDWSSLGHSILVYFVIVLFPMTIKEAVTRSESYLASWIFFVTPAEKVRLVLALKKILFTAFIVPYMLVLSLVFLYYFNNVLHVLMHLIVLLLFSYAFLQAYLLFNPQMPFSVPRQLGQRATLLGVVMVLGPIAMIGILLLVSFFVYRDPLVYLGSVIVLWLTILLLEKYLLLRVSRKLSRLEFLG